MPKEVKLPIGINIESGDVVYDENDDIDVIDVIEDWSLGYHEGRILEHLAAWNETDELVNLYKIQSILERLIALKE